MTIAACQAIWSCWDLHLFTSRCQTSRRCATAPIRATCNTQGCKTYRALEAVSRTSIPLGFDGARRYLEKTAWAEIADDFLLYTPGTADLMAVFAVKKVVEGKEGEC